jgi:hypothetical protein
MDAELSQLAGRNDPESMERAQNLQQQTGEIETRMEIIDAESNYLTLRIHSTQIEVAQGDDGASTLSPTGVPDMNTSYENAVDLVKSLDKTESSRLLELLLEGK